MAATFGTELIAPSRLSSRLCLKTVKSARKLGLFGTEQRFQLAVSVYQSLLAWKGFLGKG